MKRKRLPALAITLLLFIHLTQDANSNIAAYDNNDRCGVAPVNTHNVHGRIVNGKELNPPHAQPWMVTVSRTKMDSTSQHSSYGCGGTLISRKHILSAVHCARNCKTVDTCKDKSVNWATLGDHDKTKNDGEIYVPITKPYYWHPDSIQTRPNGPFMYDYVIFVLKCCVDFNEFIQPACFPKQAHTALFGKCVTVLGWGDTKFEGSQSPVLQHISVKVANDTECGNFIGTTGQKCNDICYNTDYLMCLKDGRFSGKDACQYDSGGPVIYKDTRIDPVVNVVIGIVSFGFACGKPNTPGYYAPVYSQLDWIRRVIKNTNQCPNIDTKKNSLLRCSSNTLRTDSFLILYLMIEFNISVYAFIAKN